MATTTIVNLNSGFGSALAKVSTYADAGSVVEIQLCPVVAEDDPVRIGTAHNPNSTDCGNGIAPAPC